METAYDSILSFSDTTKFNEYRHALITDRGTIANGKLPISMILTYCTPAARPGLFDTDSTHERIPKELLEAGSTSKRLPGLIFRKDFFDEIIRQIIARQEINLDSVKNGLLLTRTADENTWNTLTDRDKVKLIAKNLALLNKETNTNYRIYGERLHYLTIGKVKIRTMRQNREEVAYYPLFLFVCEEVDEHHLKIKVDTAGFVNFWLDKNCLDNFFYKKWHHYEINLNNDIACTINNLAAEINNLHMIDFLEIQVDPSYIGVQIITGFEAEYIDPAWNKILNEQEEQNE